MIILFNSWISSTLSSISTFLETQNSTAFFNFMNNSMFLFGTLKLILLKLVSISYLNSSIFRLSILGIIKNIFLI